ncbi:PadR family transcriptional regulator [Priestia megaterium]
MFHRNFDRIVNGFNANMGKEDFGFGRGFGPQGKDRFFKKGNLQFVILKMLQTESKHGYQIIKDLEEEFKGFYSPSPGSVYPILQMLEDREFVSISKEGKKKVYTITGEGKQFLEENINEDEFIQRLEQFKNMDFEALKAKRNELQEIFIGFMEASREAMNDSEKQQQFNKFLAKTKEDLKNLYKENK